MPAFYSRRTNIRREERQWERARRQERTRKEKGRERRLCFAFGKNARDVHGLHGGEHGDAAQRAYAREQFRGGVCHINRDERKRKSGEKWREQERGRVRKMGKGMCAQWNSKVENFTAREKERERTRESNSRYNFGAPRKLKLLRAEHAELSAVFLLRTIRIAHPFLHFLYLLLPLCPRYAHHRYRAFHKGLLLLILSERMPPGKSRCRVAATFGVKCVSNALSYNSNFILHEFEDECECEINQKLCSRRQLMFSEKRASLNFFMYKYKKKT